MLSWCLEILIVGCTYAAASWVLARLFRWAGPAGENGADSRPTSPWYITALSGFLLAAAARSLVANVQLSTLDLGLCLWAILFVLGFLLSAIEATVFSEGSGPIKRRDVVGALLLTGIAAAVAALVMTPMSPGTVLQHLDLYASNVGWQRLGLRITGAAIIFMVAYCLIGSIAWHFVKPYYTDPSHGLKLRVPSGLVIIPLQLGRGLLATMILLPIVLAATPRDLAWCGWLSFALAIVMAIVPVLNAPEWPRYLRIVHGIEITLFSVVQAASLWWLFGT